MAQAIPANTILPIVMSYYKSVSNHWEETKNWFATTILKLQCFGGVFQNCVEVKVNLGSTTKHVLQQSWRDNFLIRKPGLRPAMRRHTSRYRSEGFVGAGVYQDALGGLNHVVLFLRCCFFFFILLLLMLLLLFSRYLQCSKQKSPSHLLRLGDDTQLYYKMMSLLLINAT